MPHIFYRNKDGEDLHRYRYIYRIKKRQTMLARNLLKLIKPRTQLISFSFSNESPPPNHQNPDHTPRYQAPESRLKEFTSYIYQLDDVTSKNKAAEMLGTLEADEVIYKTKLEQLGKAFEKYSILEAEAVRTVSQKKLLEKLIKEVIEDNKSIEQRFHRELQNIKMYGVTKLARQIIEVADHLSLALLALEKSTQQKDKKTLQSLKELHQSFQQMLHKYDICEYNPTGQLFDPNLQESLGIVDNADPAKSNHVAETQRTGWKIKDRLLRHATVLIYK